MDALDRPCDEGVIKAAPGGGLPGGRAQNWILAATILGSSMAFIDGTVVNVALPAIQSHLQTSSTTVQWVYQAYALGLGALILVGGALGDRFGRRRVFGLGIALFAVASAGCGLAQTVEQLIAARACQGLGGALLVPGSLALIAASFDDEGRGRAIGTWSGFTSIATALGPVLGGWLVENVSWRGVFFINPPLALVVLWLLVRHVPESRDSELAGALDWAGALLAVSGLGGVVYGLSAASSGGIGRPGALGPLVAGVLGLLLFVWWERRARSPMMPLGLFRSRTFSGANLLTFLLYAALGGTLYFVPFNLLQVQGYQATAVGAALLPMIVIMFALSRWAGGLVRRVGARWPLTIGPALAGVGFALFALPDIGGSYWTTFFPAAVMLGLGMAVAVAPLTTTVMGAVAERHAGTASGINNSVSRVAGLLCIAAFNLVLAATFNLALDTNLSTLPLSPAARAAVDAQRPKLAAATAPPEVGPDLRQDVQQAIDRAFVTGFRTVMLVAAGLALASALSGWLLIAGKPPPGSSAPR